MLRQLIWTVIVAPALIAQEGQQSPTPSQNEGSLTTAPPIFAEPATTIRKRVDEVSVVFTVSDKQGRFINDLKQDQILVRDDRKPPQAISDFRSETDLPLRVGLLIDASNSVRDRFRFEQDAATEFLNQIIRPRTDKAFVLGFDTTAEITQEFTDDTERLAKGVHHLKPSGGTALFDAIFVASRDRLLNLGKEPGPARKAIILISDGDDNQSRVTLQEAIEMAQRAEVIIFAISTNISGIKDRGDKVMEQFAESTGGRVFFPFKMSDVAAAFGQIEEELRSQYVLSYKPADLRLDGRFRTIEIAVANNKKLKVRARKGYFAPTE